MALHLSYSLKYALQPFGYSVGPIAAVLVGAVIGLAGLVEHGSAQQEDEGAPPPTAAEVQEKVRQWVRTQQLISEEESDWQAQKQALIDLSEIREREIDQLDEVIETAGARLTDAESRRADLIAEEDSLRNRRAELEKEIVALEDSALSLLPGFPPPLREKIKDAAERLEAADRKSSPLQNRYRDVLAVLVEAGAFNSRLTHDIDLREVDGRSIEIDVLYIGLASAYYTDRSGKYCGIGRSGPGGWIWTERPELAASIRHTIDIFQKKASPEMVKLPIQLRLDK